MSTDLLKRNHASPGVKPQSHSLHITPAITILFYTWGNKIACFRVPPGPNALHLEQSRTQEHIGRNIKKRNLPTKNKKQTNQPFQPNKQYWTLLVSTSKYIPELLVELIHPQESIGRL